MPSTSQPMTKLHEASTAEEVGNQVAAARAASAAWSNTPIEDRVSIVRTFQDALRSRRDEVIMLQSQEMGKPIRESIQEFDGSDAYIDWYLNNAPVLLEPEVTHKSENERHTVYLEPRGVAAVIAPWNYPCCNFTWPVIPNLLAGNTVVFKHSEEVPKMARLLAGIAAESKIPEGVISHVYGGKEVGALLAGSKIDLICFTGSTAAGIEVNKQAAERLIKVTLELGGSAPGIVFGDVDIEAAANSVYDMRFLNCGQVCDALKRLIVDESVAMEITLRLVEMAQMKKLGDPTDITVDFGPLVAERQQTKIWEQVKDAVDKGAAVLTGGRPPDNLQGAYFLPTILNNVTPDMRVWREETFGPVLPICTFRTEEEAISLANDTDYGLSAYVYTADRERQLRVARSVNAGMISVNNISYVHPANPFVGWGHSGLGLQHGRQAFHELCRTRIIAMEK
jgi:acyl-CoA reductase-like NAD-dependent aldehyde dehydrogenase